MPVEGGPPGGCPTPPGIVATIVGISTPRCCNYFSFNHCVALFSIDCEIFSARYAKTYVFAIFGVF